MPNFRITSCAGGGIRGVVSLVLLDKLEQLHPGFLAGTHMFAGTSTGSIIAGGLAIGMSPKELLSFYTEKAPLIFRKRFMGGYWNSKYDNEALIREIEAVFGTTKIGDLNKYILIPCYDIEKGRPKFFESKKDADMRLSDAIIASASAPTFLPVYQNRIDGGVTGANDPSIHAVAQAVHYGIKLEDIELVAFGTGKNPHIFKEGDKDWGIAQWATRILDIMMDSGPEISDYFCRHLLKERYTKIDIDLPRDIPLDSVEAIPELISLAERV